MKKKEIIKSKLEFNEIIHSNNFIKNHYYIIYIRKTNQEVSRFGFAVGKKIGNAVTRNKIRRQLKVVVDKNKLSFPFFQDYIIMVKKNILNLEFHEMNNELINLIKKKETK